MNWFSQGYAELRREFERALLRLRLRKAQRLLEQHEITLGELGWQQAEYGSDLSGVIDQLNDMERSALGLMNEGADVTRSLEVLRKQDADARAELESALAKIRETAAPFSAELQELKSALVEVKRSIIECTEKLAPLEATLTKANQDIFKLMGSELTPDFLGKRMELVSRRNEIEREADANKTQLAHAETEQHRLNSSIEMAERNLRACTDQERRMLEEFKPGERERLRGIEALEKQKRSLDKGVEKIERNKVAHFRVVGRALADGGVAPMNQPEALTHVVETRQAIASMRESLEASLALSAGLDRNDIIAYHLVFWSIVLVVIGILLFVL